MTNVTVPRPLADLGRRFGYAEAIALVATIRLWQVFPFGFSENSFDWTTATHVVLGIALIGTAIAIITNLMKGVRTIVTEP